MTHTRTARIALVGDRSPQVASHARIPLLLDALAEGHSFAVPEGVDTDKIGASFKNGILTVRLPKRPEAIKAEKKIEVKAAA